MLLGTCRKIEWSSDNPFESFSPDVWKFFAQSPKVIVNLFFLQKNYISSKSPSRQLEQLFAIFSPEIWIFFYSKAENTFEKKLFKT